VRTDPVICIVDDDEVLRDGLAAFFKSARIRALAFSSAEAVLEGQTHTAMDCLVTDLRMSGMNGLLLSRELLRRGGRTPAVLATACLTQQVPDAASVPRIKVVLEKPADPELLLAEIDALLGHSDAGDPRQPGSAP